MTIASGTSATPTWNDMFNALLLHLETMGELPETGASSEQTALARWLRAQRRAYHEKTLVSGKWDKLCSAPPQISSLFASVHPLGDKWCAQVENMVSLVAKQGRLPDQNVTSETEAAQFLKQLLQSKKHGSLTAQQAQVLRGLPNPLGELFAPARDPWLVKANELISFVDSTGRLPRQNQADERKLSSWMYRQVERNKRGKLQPAHLAKLRSGSSLLLPMFDSCTPSAARWQANLRAISQIALQTGTIPSRFSQDSEERRLYRWLCTQLTSQRQGTLSASRQAQLDAAPEVIRQRFRRTRANNILPLPRCRQDEEDTPAALAA